MPKIGDAKLYVVLVVVPRSFSKESDTGSIVGECNVTSFLRVPKSNFLTYNLHGTCRFFFLLFEIQQEAALVR
jgi:hypothetical protein